MSFSNVGLVVSGALFFPEQYTPSELLSKTYAAKEFGEKRDLMSHAHFVLWLLLLDYTANRTEIEYFKCMV